MLETKESDNIKVIDFGTSRVFDPNIKMNHKFGTVRFYIKLLVALLHSSRSIEQTV